MNEAKSQWNKPAQRDQSCSNCNAFLPNLAANPKSGEGRQGWCRATPPQVMPTTVQVPGTSLNPNGPQLMNALQGVTPPTKADGWCRAWEPMEADDGRTADA